MKILSIDVGIKNLAFCLLEYDKDIVIHKWNSINICEDEKKVCKEIKKKSKTACLKNAKYHKNGKFYCKIHAKNSKFFIPTVETNLILKKIKKKRISNKLLNQYMNTYLPESNIKNKEDKIKKLREHLENTYLENVEKININELNMIDCGIFLKKRLDEHFKEEKIDLVLIENQIGPLALRMKMLQGMITQHFIENKLTNNKFISASNKLKGLTEKKKLTYSERKKLGIKMTRKIINENNFLNKLIEIFDKHRKKDDLADSFLQARWYIKNTYPNN